jgi:hypothetical protein
MLVGTLVRFLGFSAWSLSNDELSAFYRIWESDLGETIQKGVRPDGHPAGVQVFLYFWTQFFGTSEFALRFPFVLFGCFSIFLVYLISKKWFGNTAALLSSAAWAVLYEPVLYSQIARPYSSGVFFVLLFTYFWQQLVFESDITRPPRKFRIFLLALSSSLALYNHYFSGFTVILLWGIGLFFLNRFNRMQYFLSGLISLLLFLPHLEISIAQFSKGGVGIWLGPPKWDFLFHYLFTNTFNSWHFPLVALSILGAGILMGSQGRDAFKYKSICLIIFAVVYLVGHLYSVYVNPVLQSSVLLFCFPFLVMGFFSFTKNLSIKLAIGGSFLMLGSGLAGLYIDKKFALEKPFASFREPVQTALRWKMENPGLKTEIFFNAISRAYLEYYTSRQNNYPDFSFSRGDDADFGKHFAAFVDQSDADQIIYGWTNIRHPISAFEIIFSRGYELKSSVTWYNAAIYRFEKSKNTDPETNLPDSSNTRLTFSRDTEFFNQIEFSGDSPDLKGDKNLLFIARLDSLSGGGIHLVKEVHENDSLISWESAYSPHYGVKESGTLSLLVRRKGESLSGKKIKVYFWNPEKQSGQISRFKQIPITTDENIFFD